MTKTSEFSGRRLVALVVLCAATMMTVLDETVVNVAIPSIQRDLGFGATELSWIVNGYLVSFGSLLLLAGRVGDLIGRRRVLLVGLALFTAASLACGLAPSAGVLVGARFAQGAGAALASSVALGMIVSLFDDPAPRARAIGIYAFMASAGASAGLFLGGVITDLAGWRWAFFLNVPIGVIMLVIGVRVLTHETGTGLRAGADYPGAVLLVGGVAATILAVVDPSRRAMVIPAVVLLAAFAVRQLRTQRPLLPLAVLRSRAVIGANLVLMLLGGSMLGFQFLITVYFQNVLGYSPAQAGCAILPIAIGIGGLSLFGYPRISRRVGARVLIVPGMLMVALGLFLLVFAPTHGNYAVSVLPSMLLFAIGGGTAIPAIMSTAMSETTPDALGASSGLLNTSQQVGSAIGLAVLSSIAAATTARLGEHGQTATSAAVGGYHVGWGIGAALITVAAAIAAITLRRPRTQVLAEPQLAGSSPGRLNR
ncbi:MFS transporter [Kribbella kalugense]|uniref:EmrB/QacA subfamily drug resistance transporter n=1 Tax=Kribbella kalugense TaxID=2512221 RepID=A0A4R7ZUX6_9ACTN|nr:MFS transporter [Kribbella kalugense]TDW21406.1 EmrB/QacA subfamily drug resistance transporter [Kribbella kalugense]